MNYPLSAYSWTLLSGTVAIKKMDKSAFLHHGTGIPREIAHFFDLPDEGLKGNKPVTLIANNIRYDAHFQMDAHLERFRLFWRYDLSNHIKESYPQIYKKYELGDDDQIDAPLMRFSLVQPDVYRIEFLDSPDPKSDWTDEELEAAIKAYFLMLSKESAGENYNKSENNRELRTSILMNRSKGAVEFRMQNISAVLQELCHPFIQGYLPRGNVGTEVSERIKRIIFQNRLLNEDDYDPTSDDKDLEGKVEAILNKGVTGKPSGRLKPITKQSSQTMYERDPLVKAWVLHNANDKCELCGKRGPFIDTKGRFFLEVHHVVPLAEGGADIIENTVALCPNCHKECHYSKNKDDIVKKLKVIVNRLKD